MSIPGGNVAVAQWIIGVLGCHFHQGIIFYVKNLKSLGFLKKLRNLRNSHNLLKFKFLYIIHSQNTKETLCYSNISALGTAPSGILQNLGFHMFLGGNMKTNKFYWILRNRWKLLPTVKCHSSLRKTRCSDSPFPPGSEYYVRIWKSTVSLGIYWNSVNSRYFQGNPRFPRN